MLAAAKQRKSNAMDATSNFSFSFANGSESLTTVDRSAYDPVPERAPFLQLDISTIISAVYHYERTKDLLDQPALALFRQQWQLYRKLVDNNYLESVPHFGPIDDFNHNMMYLETDFAGFSPKRCRIRVSHALRPACDHVYPLRR